MELGPAPNARRGRVLVIDGDEWMGNALTRVLREKGFEAELCVEARVGFHRACETKPDCVICSVELPDIDGAWVARRLRTESGSISKVPLVFLGDATDKTVRTQSLSIGVDVFLERPPISNDEIAAQVDALIAMARRLDTSDEAAPSSTSVSAAIRGDLSAFPLASMLMMFEMERRSGTVQVVAQSGRRAILTISDGLFASTEVGGAQRPALEVLREVLGWRAGRFSFQPRESGSLPAPRASVGALVLEAMRLEDEEKSQADFDDIEVVVDSMRSPPVSPASGNNRSPSEHPPANAGPPRPTKPEIVKTTDPRVGANEPKVEVRDEPSRPLPPARPKAAP